MDSVDLGTRVAQWRRFRDLTQAELAKKASRLHRATGRRVRATQSAIGQIETGRTQPSMALLDNIVEALDLTMEKFYGRLPKVA